MKYFVHYFSQHSWEILSFDQRETKLREMELDKNQVSYDYYKNMRKFDNIDTAKIYLMTRLRQDRDVCDKELKNVKALR